MQNLKNYTVIFYLSWFFDEIEFKCKNLKVQFKSKNIGHELIEDAYHAIKKEYKNFFDYDNFEIHIIGVGDDS